MGYTLNVGHAYSDMVDCHSGDMTFIGQRKELETAYAFAGESRDAHGWQYHRARYYAPAQADLSLFPAPG